MQGILPVNRYIAVARCSHDGCIAVHTQIEKCHLKNESNSVCPVAAWSVLRWVTDVQTITVLEILWSCFCVVGGDLVFSAKIGEVSELLAMPTEGWRFEVQTDQLHICRVHQVDDWNCLSAVHSLPPLYCDAHSIKGNYAQRLSNPQRNLNILEGGLFIIAYNS